MPSYLLGYDVGSSSVKACLVDVDTGQTITTAQSPTEEMPMLAVQAGWAEQDPEMWWENAISCTKKVLQKSSAKADEVVGIGIAYQMHGLVCVDKNQRVLRPSIIWCDSRAVEIGNKAFQTIGEKYCLQNLLNSPGNFTASKLKWVKENEPDVYAQIDKVMLPGDFLAMKLSGEIQTTASGLSEGVFWDFKAGKPSEELLQYYGIEASLLPTIEPTFSVQGKLQSSVAEVLGLKAGTPIGYRAGDQPNNAFSLNVTQPGETAATAGTSGVIYTVTDQHAFDQKSRVNTFLHVNHSQEAIRNGILLCVNGTGILNSWLRKMSKSEGSLYEYNTINTLASTVPIGSDGLRILPFGNGAERILENQPIQASFHGLNFNRHSQAHLFRAAQEGIVFALKYGFDILQAMGAKTTVIKAGHANMFLSPLFREAFVNTIGAPLELYDTDGAKGAALGAGIGCGLFSSTTEAFSSLKMIGHETPDAAKAEQYATTYTDWLQYVKL